MLKVITEIPVGIKRAINMYENVVDSKQFDLWQNLQFILNFNQKMVTLISL